MKNFRRRSNELCSNRSAWFSVHAAHVPCLNTCEYYSLASRVTRCSRDYLGEQRERVIKWHNYRMVICTSVSTSRRDGVKFHRRVTRRCRNALQLLMRFVGLLEKLKYSLWPLENKQFSERQFRPDPWNNNCTVNSRDRERDEASSVVACLSSTLNGCCCSIIVKLEMSIDTK